MNFGLSLQPFFYQHWLLMAIITITSDLNYKDYYLAAIKGTLINELPDCQIVDLAHSEKPFDSLAAAYNLKNGYHFFPEGSIHLLSVNESESPDVSHVVVHSKGHYFVGPDNGIFSIVLGNEAAEIYALNSKVSESESFPALQKFSDAIIHIAKGLPIQKIGYKRERLNPALYLEPAYDEDVIRGSVIYIDHYGNAITNVSKKLFDSVGKGRKFNIIIKTNAPVNKINKRYNETPNGYPLAIFNNNGLLEIASYQGSAVKLFGIQYNQIIRIEFI